MAGSDPIVRFQNALENAVASEPFDATAMALSTVDEHGRPSVRMVLLKSADQQGFRFFTNRASRKAGQLAAQPFAALCFHWPANVEQVRIEGRVERLPERESDEYFATRPRGSQIGAWASRQSEVLASREALEERTRLLEARFAGGPVPRPPFWGGYLLVPDRIEFWHGQPSRLHDRWLYVRSGEGWTVERLYP
jgi:pyridoxamine 5'-phosphate oxidase